MPQLAGKITGYLYRFAIQVSGIVAGFKHRLRIVFITLALSALLTAFYYCPPNHTDVPWRTTHSLSRARL